MVYKSATQPLCRYCGKPIAKYTTSAYFGVGPVSSTIREFPRDKAEAQRFVNGRIIAVKYWRGGDNFVRATGFPDHDFVSAASLWDGESYVDEFFCTQNDARRFAYLFAREGKVTTAYNKAAMKQALKSNGKN